jgi:hypothetical protein
MQQRLERAQSRLTVAACAPDATSSIWHCVAHRSLAGRPVALASSGEALELPCVHAREPRALLVYAVDSGVLNIRR